MSTSDAARTTFAVGLAALTVVAGMVLRSFEANVVPEIELEVYAGDAGFVTSCSPCSGDIGLAIEGSDKPRSLWAWRDCGASFGCRGPERERCLRDELIRVATALMDGEDPERYRPPVRARRGPTTLFVLDAQDVHARRAQRIDLVQRAGCLHCRYRELPPGSAFEALLSRSD